MATLTEYQSHAQPDDLTIVMVSWKSADLVRQNVEATRKLNPGQRVWWLVLENSEEDTAWVDDGWVEWVVQVPGTRITDAEKATIGWGSFHHAKSLNIGLAYAQTDHVLVLDPDCFVVMPNWVDRVRRAMATSRLVFWGTPYHPERFGRFNVFGQQYMYFPTAICMMIDRRRLQSEFHSFVLDFTPPFGGRRNVTEYREEVRDLIRGRRVGRQWRLVRGWLRLLRCYGLSGIWDGASVACRRLTTGRNPDTGFMIYKRYHRSVPHGVTSVMYTRPFPRFFWLWKWIIPQWCLGYPKKRAHWTAVGKELLRGVPAGRGRWEVFIWKDEPFAIHLGSVGHGAAVTDMSPLEEVLKKQSGCPVKAA